MNIQEHVFKAMGRKWNTYWDVREKLLNKGIYYSETSISAAIRDFRKPRWRKRFDLPREGEVLLKERRGPLTNGVRGYKYKLVTGD